MVTGPSAGFRVLGALRRGEGEEVTPFFIKSHTRGSAVFQRVTCSFSEEVLEESDWDTGGTSGSGKRTSFSSSLVRQICEEGYDAEKDGRR